MGKNDVVLVEGARALGNEKEVRKQLVGGTDHIPNSFDVSTTTQSPCVPSPALIHSEDSHLHVPAFYARAGPLSGYCFPLACPPLAGIEHRVCEG